MGRWKRENYSSFLSIHLFLHHTKIFIFYFLISLRLWFHTKHGKMEEALRKWGMQYSATFSFLLQIQQTEIPFISETHFSFQLNAKLMLQAMVEGGWNGSDSNLKEILPRLLREVFRLNIRWHLFCCNLNSTTSHLTAIRYHQAPTTPFPFNYSSWIV